MNEVQINKIKKRADEYATSCFPYEKQFLEREAVVKCCVHVVTETIAELEKENAELKCECRRCVYSDCPCILSDYEKDRNGICDHFKDAFDENAELKKQLEMSNKVYNDNLDYSHHIEEQLTKAKNIIEDYMIVVKGGNITVCSVPEENRCINVLKLNEQAEQFLKDSEVEK